MGPGNKVEVPHRCDRRKKLQGVSASIRGNQIRRDRHIKSLGVSPAFKNTENKLVPFSQMERKLIYHLEMYSEMKHLKRLVLHLGASDFFRVLSKVLTTIKLKR